MVLTIPRGVVRNLKVLSNMPVGGCSEAHMVHVLLGKIDPGLTQDLYMYNLDSWLCSGAVSNLMSLPESRDRFWKIVRTENGLLAAESTAERTLNLPDEMAQSNKRRTVSGSPS
jgi:hypothetical protein